MKNVLFNFEVDAGNLAGTGHFFRCLKIYNSIKKKYNKKLNYFFLFRDYRMAKSIVNKHFRDNIIIKDRSFYKRVSFLSSDDLVINDTPRSINKSFLNFCKEKNVKNLLLIDHDKIKYPHKYYLINGIFSLKKKLSNQLNLYQGFKYILLDKKFNYVKKKLNKKFNILISSGGSDEKNITYKIYNSLKKLPNIFLYIIIGPAFKKNNPILKLKKKNVLLVKNKKNIKPYFEKTDLSITAGGITMFESICCKNITLVTELYTNQKFAIKKLKKLGMIHLIGKNKKIFSKILYNLINKYIKLKKKNKIKYLKNFRLIDGRSMLRIEKIIFKIIDKHI